MKCNDLKLTVNACGERKNKYNICPICRTRLLWCQRFCHSCGHGKTTQDIVACANKANHLFHLEKEVRWGAKKTKYAEPEEDQKV